MSAIVEAERSVLGSVLIDCAPIPAGVDLLSPGDFADARHATVWAVALRLHQRNEPIDVVTVMAELGTSPAPQGGWGSFLAGLMESTPTAANGEYWARIVRTEAMRRDAIRAATELLDGLKRADTKPDALVGDFSLRLGQLAAGRQRMRAVAMRELVTQEYTAMQTRGTAGITGLSTGFPDLDNKLGGFDVALVLIAGRPSMGKSALGTGIAQNIALRNDTGDVLVFSLEMAAQQQAQRAIASEGRVDLNAIRTGKLDPREWDRVAQACNLLNTDKIAVVDEMPKVSEMRGIARAYAARRKLACIVVDYLQIVPFEDGDNREQQVASISRGLKALSKELGVPVIALSQLSRALEQRQDKRPMLSDLRESGALEQDADQILFVYRDEYYHPKSPDAGIAEIGIGKNRNGATGVVRLRWNGRFTRFDSLEQQRLPLGEQPF